ncbi:MAG TPA: phospholipid carrier-dependent glycosyltransferase [Candidatus Lustribacter sp.]|nr:phospholipid carrier-dependent glycosyltransferase [Candidatus Lustribacter sp.]
MTREAQLRMRLLGPAVGDRLLGWLGPLAAMAVGGLLRFWDLARPHQLVFDETYYVKQGWSMVLYGFEMRNDPVLDAAKQIDQNFTGTNQSVYGTVGDLVVHPPVGKWLIGWGEQIFGVTSSFGWRFAAAVVGTLSILMVGRIGRRLLGSSLLGTVAALLLAFEGHHFVHSRTGLLDVFVMFFALAGFAALLIDRDSSRARLARVLAEPLSAPSALGPWLGLRPWRWVAGVALGLCTGTKWSGLFVLAVFGVMTVLWDAGARRTVGVRRWLRGAAVRDGPLAFVALVVVACLTYVASWTGWFRTSGGYDRHWAVEHPSARFGWVPGALRSLWHYHGEIYQVSRGITSAHDYQSSPWSWLVQGRPTSFFYEGPKRGEMGCTVDLCSKAITSVGTPVIWWAGTIGVVVLLFRWALRRDWRAGAILAGFLGLYVPWFGLGDRTIFTFYAVAFAPFVVLTVTYLCGLAIGPAGASRRRRRLGLGLTGSFVVASVLVFAFFYPIYTAWVVPYDFWRIHMWFPSWI